MLRFLSKWTRKCIGNNAMHLNDLGLEIFWCISFGNVFITLAVKRQQPDRVRIDETQITRNLHDSVDSGRRKMYHLFLTPLLLVYNDKGGDLVHSVSGQNQVVVTKHETVSSLRGADNETRSRTHTYQGLLTTSAFKRFHTIFSI